MALAFKPDPVLAAHLELQRNIDNQKFLRSSIIEDEGKLLKLQALIHSRKEALAKAENAEPELRKKYDLTKANLEAEHAAQTAALHDKRAKLLEQLKTIETTLGK